MRGALASSSSATRRAPSTPRQLSVVVADGEATRPAGPPAPAALPPRGGPGALDPGRGVRCRGRASRAPAAAHGRSPSSGSSTSTRGQAVTSRPVAGSTCARSSPAAALKRSSCRAAVRSRRTAGAAVRERGRRRRCVVTSDDDVAEVGRRAAPEASRRRPTGAPGRTDGTQFPAAIRPSPCRRAGWPQRPCRRSRPRHLSRSSRRRTRTGHQPVAPQTSLVRQGDGNDDRAAPARPDRLPRRPAGRAARGHRRHPGDLGPGRPHQGRRRPLRRAGLRRRRPRPARARRPDARGRGRASS